ncbi:MAG: hypothetical protein COA67_04175 [Lutibacter sp.]|nr:MAG: hypothetical protein COA67_04175 [Lutibacter sp.]
MSNSINKPNTGFWVISIVALIWNAMGVMAYFGQVYMTDDVKNALPEAQRALYENVPSWVTAAFAIAVFAGLLGCLLLVLRKKLATTVLTISLLGVIAQMIYNFFMSNAAEAYGPGGMIMPIMVLVIAFFLVWFSKNATAKGWLS